LIAALRQEVFLMHGAGSANLGTLSLLVNEGKVPRSNLFVTNSRGLIWKSEDGETGSYRNEQQKEFGKIGEPTYNTRDLVRLIEVVQPTCLIGAVGVMPNCFNQQVIEAMAR
jgi:malic enzyme